MKQLPQLQEMSVGFVDFSHGLRNDFVNVGLWMEKPSSRATEFCGTFLRNGRFKVAWTATLRIQGKEILTAKGTRAEATLEGEGISATRLAVDYYFFKGNSISFSIAGQQWTAIYPGRLMIDGERRKDKYVEFKGTDEFCICAIPAEHYIQINSETRVSTEVTRLTQGNGLGQFDSESQWVLLTVALLGYSFFL